MLQLSDMLQNYSKLKQRRETVATNFDKNTGESNCLLHATTFSVNMLLLCIDIFCVTTVWHCTVGDFIFRLNLSFEL